MKLTRLQKDLIEGLTYFDLTEDDQKGIFLFCDTPEKQLQILCFLADNEEATRDEIVDKIWTMLPKNSMMLT